MQTQGDAYAIGFYESSSRAPSPRPPVKRHSSPPFSSPAPILRPAFWMQPKAAWASEGKLPDAILLSMLSEQRRPSSANQDLYLGRQRTGVDGPGRRKVIGGHRRPRGRAGPSAVFGTNPGTPSGEAYTKFAAAYKALWGEDPGPVLIAHAYDAAYLIAGAMVLSTDPSLGDGLKTNIWKATGRTDVEGDYGDTFGPDQWAAMRPRSSQPAKSYEGASGAVDFDLNGDVLSTSGVDHRDVRFNQELHDHPLLDRRWVEL